MRNSNKWVRALAATVGIVALTAGAGAIGFDATISINRAANSPTFTVQYSGANAALVELRLNGVSLGTRSVASTRESGEANFSIDLRSLQDGDNTIEVYLLDKTGKIVGTERSIISAEQGSASMITIASPKMGATVQGPVEIKVGFGQQMRNSYVSFFIDNQFKSMTNNAPFNYVWDTMGESNGWHELEAWLVDENSSTFKTRKVRVFVNNPGGRTDRTTAPLVAPTIKPVVKPIAKPVPTLPKVSPSIATAAPLALATAPANVVPMLAGDPQGLKPIALPKATLSGPKALVPAVKAVTVPTVKPAVAPVARPVIEVRPAVKPALATVPRVTLPRMNNVAGATGLLRITQGTRLPNMGSLMVSLNGKPVKFDVQPRVQDNIPLTPFRHLIEKAGGKVKWEHLLKQINALADGKEIYLQIGDANAKIGGKEIALEKAPFIENGRTIVPISFIEQALNVTIEYDAESGRVLITSKK